MSGTDVDHCLDFGASRPAVVLMSYYWQKTQHPMASRPWKLEVTSDRAELVACPTTTFPLSTLTTPSSSWELSWAAAG